MRIHTITVGPLDTNCYCVDHNKSAFLVDPGDDYDTILKYLEENSLNLDFVVLTHGHADHIKEASKLNVPIYIHKEDKICLYDSAYNLSSFVGAPFAFSKDLHVLELQDGDSIDWQGKVLKVIHTPGHSKGGISILLDESLFSGDTLFRFSIGRTDLSGGSYEQLMQSINQRLFVLPDTVKVYPGHGGSSTIGEEKKLNPFMNT